MSLTIIDASVALKWVWMEADSEAAAALLDGRPLAAPALWLTEAANALWKLAQRQALSADEAEDRLAFLIQAPVRLIDTSPLLPAALRIAQTLQHPLYDCLYLAAALHLSAKVVTADRRFHRAASAHPIYADAIMTLD
ncbi:MULTISPECIES: type II toxin-antitoxin system VapC family toxin [Nitrospirillum]|uniref:Ribonuclease VapC n=1 Tax=Nitrospirillum amazonense TaxID=28077 RepID=A0A560GA22_9PROT|nr:type II toxin-antitoxin system VapC family toxin [Nitrospirillum amazonense]MEC4591254.1 type II toxin-antitoxin system VapC family toxin [Nitrospirillum amazonense]TWB30758.1 putative nucleic acid-binding protein [Nitrospirillum amazonense]